VHAFAVLGLSTPDPVPAPWCVRRQVWMNAVGFVRLVDADFRRRREYPHPLEFTRIHPESYPRAVEVRLGALAFP
jgi:hypothetical protein